MPTTSDTGVRQFRRWWKASGLADTTFFGPSCKEDLHWLPRGQQLSRFHSHTENCAPCLRALARAKQVRSWAVIAAVIPLALGLPLPVRILGVVAFVALRAGAISLVRTLEGPESASDLERRADIMLKD
mmetsp:Transcript_7977/g.27082  ORF Transcript_7977/g.27082 Transcript_7977/m.27082 type:complete len:129 (-) Transcript_7977:106-492(-)